MDWLSKLSAWIVIAALKHWFTTALVFLAKLIFSLFPENDKQAFQDQSLPDTPTPKEPLQ